MGVAAKKQEHVPVKFVLALSVLRQQNFSILHSFFLIAPMPAVRRYTCHTLMRTGFFHIFWYFACKLCSFSVKIRKTVYLKATQEAKEKALERFFWPELSAHLSQWAFANTQTGANTEMDICASKCPCFVRIKQHIKAAACNYPRKTALEKRYIALSPCSPSLPKGVGGVWGILHVSYIDRHGHLLRTPQKI